MIHAEIRKAIRKARKVAGLTQVELAKQAKISSAAKFSSYEEGYGKLSEEELKRVIKAIDRAQARRIVPLASLANPTVPVVYRKLCRQRVGLSQAELALRAGVSQAWLSKFELGQITFSREDERRWWAAIEEARKALPSTRLEEQLRENAVLVEQVEGLQTEVEGLREQLGVEGEPEVRGNVVVGNFN